MSFMLLAICGKSGSGKTTLLYYLEQLGFERIVTYTTRPKRPGEEDDITYHYIDKDLFNKLNESHFFAETTSYYVNGGDKWFYGTANEDLKSDKDQVLIVNPDGLATLRQFKVPMIAFYIDVPDFELRKRLEKRGDNKDEIKRRLMADEEDFNEKIINRLVDWYVADWWSSPFDMAEKIERVYRNHLERLRKDR